MDFQIDADPTTAWKRWYKKAIAKSVSQLNGATRHLLFLRTQIYKDRACTIPLGIPIPTPDRARMYRVGVVSLSSELSDAGRPIPFLKISSIVTSSEHLAENASSFVVGDVEPDKEFVHVMDVAGLWALLSTVDTITDFARYLDSRCEFIRGKESNTANSEWSILTRYLLSHDAEGESVALDHANPSATQLDDTEWQGGKTQIALSARRSADCGGYLWDSLIEDQAEMLERQRSSFFTYNNVEEAEQVVRHMALESRINRRLLSRLWREAGLRAKPEYAANIRTVPHSMPDSATYVLLNVSNFLKEPYESYRTKRRSFSKKMMLASHVDTPTSKVVIGTAAAYGSAPHSYDLAYLDVEANASDGLKQEAYEAWLLKSRPSRTSAHPSSMNGTSPIDNHKLVHGIFCDMASDWYKSVRYED